MLSTLPIRLAAVSACKHKRNVEREEEEEEDKDLLVTGKGMVVACHICHH